jgi:hypothetical protein
MGLHPQRFPLLLALLIHCTPLVAQSLTTSTSVADSASTSTSSASINPGVGLYTYAGCYNETTGVANSGGVRALGGGTMV